MTRPRWTIAGAIAGIAGTVLAVVAVAHRERPAAIDVTPATVTTENDFVTPSYLPPGTTLVATHGGSGATFVEKHYQLPGPANADTIPAGGLDDTNVFTAHAATLLMVTFVPGVSTVPDVPAEPAYFDAKPVVVGGVPGLMTTPKHGLGAFRIDWVDDAGYHVVLCERLTTPEGISGLPADELLEVANSLYA